MPDKSALAFFEELSRLPGAAGLYRARRIAKTHSYLAASNTGEPTFLIPVSPGTSHYVPTMSLAGLEVNFGAECRIQEPDKREASGKYVVMQCCSRDELTKQCFVQMLYPAVEGLGDHPSFMEIRALVDTASELFSLAGARPESARGLWGELFLLSLAKDISQALPFWRAENTERYDFSDAEVRLEVKTTLSATRTHIFSLEQLRPADNILVIVASLLLQLSTGGISLADLVERISKELTSAEYRTFLVKVNSALRGASFNDIALTFDEQAALMSLRFYESQSIPSVNPGVPPQVTNVHFTVDLSTTRPLQCIDSKSRLLAQFQGLLAPN